MAINTDMYMQQKVADLNRTGYQGKTWDLASAQAAFQEAGLTPEQHYAQYGKDEGFYNPTAAGTGNTPIPMPEWNPATGWDQGAATGGQTFLPQGWNAQDYLAQKTAQLNQIGHQGKTWDLASTVEAFNQAGLTPEQHYAQYGQSESFYSPEELELYQPDKFPRSYSGIGGGYLDQLMPTLIDDLLASLQGFDTNVEGYYKSAMDRNNANTKDMLSGVLEGTVNNMTSRGILDSSITSDAIGTATGEVLKNVQNQNMQAGLESAKMRLSKPNLLGDLMRIGQFSYSEDPSQPVKTLASLFL